MNLSICSLASGSSGNSYLVRSDRTAILVDAGISARQIRERIGSFGLDIGDISAVLITHEHSDHIKGLKVLVKNSGIRIVGNASTLRASDAGECDAGIFIFETGDCFEIGDIKVTSFPVSHDAADPVGYFFEKNGCRISIVTDTGIITEEIRSAMHCADILVLESNHDVNVLKMGSYPWFLKQRILGENGHLSNEAAAEAFAALCAEEKQAGTFRRKTVLLAHLSRENNFPEMALMTMSNYLEEAGLVLSREVVVEVLPRSEKSKYYFV